jgi:hypothetical protein
MVRVQDSREVSIMFAYRHRPAAAVREAQREQNRAGFEKLCAAYGNKPDRDDPYGPYQRVRESLPRRLRELLDPVTAMVPSVEPDPRRQAWALAVRVAAPTLGVTTRCRGMRSWTALDGADVLATPEEDLPPGDCDARVAQLKALARRPHVPAPIEPKLGIPVRAINAIDVVGPVFDAADAPPADASRIAKEQRRARPLVYLKVRARMPVGELVDALKQWSATFEVRLLATRAGTGPLALSSHAWTDALGTFNPLPITRAFALDDDVCPGASDAARVAEEQPVELQFSALANGIAKALKHCGCPRVYSELAFTKVVAVADAWEADGWIAPQLTENPRAQTLRLSRADEAWKLVEALSGRAAPLHIEWLQISR